MTTRRPRSDSKTGAKIAVAAALAGSIEPPGHVRLREGDRPFWDAIVCARARDRWDDHDLALAGNLARSMADLEKLQAALDLEGHTMLNAKGTPVANPTHTVLETLTRRVVALSRALHVHAEAKDGESREQGKTLGKQREAGKSLDRAGVKDPVGDDLGASSLFGGRGKTH